jgi:hypothetical protein
MPVNFIPADTTREATLVQLNVYRTMLPSRRLELALAMGDTLRRTLAAGVRWRHPDYSAKQVKLAVNRITLGEELFRQVYPGVEVDV